MTTEQINFQNLINHLCKRPEMYVMGGTFQEVIALLWGYRIAMQRLNLGEDAEIDRFQRWAVQKYDCPPAMNYLCIILQKYPNDASRFRRLRFTFNKFIKSENNS